MTGHVAGMSQKNGMLLFRLPNEGEADCRPLTTEEYVVVSNAMGKAHAKLEAEMHRTGIIDLDGHNRLVKQAGQDALVDFNMEQRAK